MVIIRWTNEAEIWLKDIHDYIAHDSKKQAKRIVNEIYDEAQILQKFPRSGRLYNTVDVGEIRIILYKHYRITYLIKKNDNIDILGVFHGSLDLDRYLPFY